MRKIIISFLSIAVVLSGAFPVTAEEPNNTIAYKLAVIHTRTVNPDQILLKNQEPPNSVISEFQWILDTIYQRSVNSMDDIATILVEAWQMVKKRGYRDATLLETAHTLSDFTRNNNLFGNGKVNFEKTTEYWILAYRPEKRN